MNIEQITTLIVIIAAALVLIYGNKIIDLCFHDPESIQLGKTKFLLPVRAQYDYIRGSISMANKDPVKLNGIYNQATISLKWQKEKPTQVVCPEKYYRIEFPGLNLNGNKFGVIYMRKDKS